MFLGEYFYTEPGALNFLQNVSANDIDHISAANLRIITTEHLSIPPPKGLGSLQDIPGQNNKTQRKIWHPRSNTADFKPSDDSNRTLTSEEEIELPYQAARLFKLPENTHMNLHIIAHHLIHPLFLARGTEANPLKR